MVRRPCPGQTNDCIARRSRWRQELRIPEMDVLSILFGIADDAPRLRYCAFAYIRRTDGHLESP